MPAVLVTGTSCYTELAIFFTGGGCSYLSGWLYTDTDFCGTVSWTPDTVSHPITNQAWCRVTSLIETIGTLRVDWNHTFSDSPPRTTHMVFTTKCRSIDHWIWRSCHPRKYVGLITLCFEPWKCFISSFIPIFLDKIPCSAYFIYKNSYKLNKARLKFSFPSASV